MPSAVDLPDPDRTGSLTSPALAGRFFATVPPGKPYLDVYVYVCAHPCPTFCYPWTVACQAPLSIEFYRQGYWTGLPFPSPGDLPDPGIEPAFLMSVALVGRFFTTSAT